MKSLGNSFLKIVYFSFACAMLCMHAQAQVFEVAIKDASSLVRTGMNPHPMDEKADTLLAYSLRNAILRMDIDTIIYVRDAYRKKAEEEAMQEKAWGSLAYILDRMVRESIGENTEETDALTDDLYHYFTGDRCRHLINYLLFKYELDGYKPQSVSEFVAQRTFYDDILMFNDPGRSSWDHTEEIMRHIPVKRGDKVVDVGCGFGYNSYRLLKLVGDKGLVYSTDTEKAYVDYLNRFATNNNLQNLRPVHTTSNNLGVDDKVDCIFMSSLYHIIYTWSREDERKGLLETIVKNLKNKGYLVIVDNKNLHGGELNNCHVDPRLLQAQFGFWGFKPISYTDLGRQRYMLVFQKKEGYQPSVRVKNKKGLPVLSIKNQKSIVHIGSLDSYDITDRGIDAANYVYDFMGGGDPSLAEVAIKKYDELIPMENFGGEYSALQWLCEVGIANDKQRNEMLKDPLVSSFYHYLTDDSCKVIRYYLLHKYKLGNDSIRLVSDSLLEKSGEVGRTHRSFLEDYILALNPKRPQWENTAVILENLGIREGLKIADIGSGSGFFTYKFSQMVSKSGKVYALEMKDEHLERLAKLKEKAGLDNIEVIKGKEDVLELPEKVDMMFMCSLYHIMYAVTSDTERDAYLKSLVQQLKSDGELIIVDNCPVDDDTLPYHGPYISRELIETQLSYYGFELTDYVQVIPQRYLLKFRLRK